MVRRRHARWAGLRRAALQNQFLVSRRSFASRRAGAARGGVGLHRAGDHRSQHAGRRRAGARGRQAVGSEADHRRRDRLARRPFGRAVGHRSRFLRPVGPADHSRAPPGSQRRVPSHVRRARRARRRLAVRRAAERSANETCRSRRSRRLATARLAGPVSRTVRRPVPICWPSFARAPTTRQTLARLVALSKHSRVPLVAAGDVHYHARSRLALARRADGHPPRLHGGRGGRSAVSQRRAAT